MLTNLDRVMMLLGIGRPTANVVVFPNQGIDKAHIFELFERKGSSWFEKLLTAQCCMVVRVLNIILVHNFL